MIEVNKSYMNLSREERRSHLALNEPCLERGGDSRNHKGILAYVLKTTIPSGKDIHLCHACHNGKCSNPHHLYWGTYQDNIRDAIDNGKKSIHQYSVEKHGPGFQTGSNNSSFGKSWINDGQTSKLIERTTPIPDGWTKGRR